MGEHIHRARDRAVMDRFTHAADNPQAALLHVEQQLRALHELRPEARLRPGLEVLYVEFLRALRERLHPRGVRDVRNVLLPDGATFQVDLGDRLGCDLFYGYVDERFEVSLFAAVLEPDARQLEIRRGLVVG